MRKNKKNRFSIFAASITLLAGVCVGLSACRNITPTIDNSPKYDVGIVKGTQIGSYPVNNDSSLSKTFAYANSIANRVQGFYTNEARTSYALQNTGMSLVHRLSGTDKLVVSAISNSKGVAYATDTLDVYVKDLNGNVFFAGESFEEGRMNTTRLGYYYYETHIRDLEFAKTNSHVNYEKTSVIELGEHWGSNQMSKPVYKKSVLKVKAENTVDPYVFVNNLSIPAEDYNAILIEMKATGNTTEGDLYFYTGRTQGFNAQQRASFKINSDGKYHTYLVDLTSSGIDKENLNGVRFDMGVSVGDEFEIKSVKAVKTNKDTISYKVDKTYHTYSDKMHQEYTLVKTTDGENYDFSEFGVELKIPKDNVLEYKISYAQDNKTVEYVAVIVKEAGVIGFIMPVDSVGYNVTVTEEAGYITVRQFCRDGVIGSRVYNDESQNYDGIIAAAYEERNPLTEITVKSEKTVNAKFIEYDTMRGSYKFTCRGTDFSTAYYKKPDYHYTTGVTIQNKFSQDRKLYMWMTGESGALECATVTDSEDRLMPIPVQVSKNFSGEKEEPFYDPNDVGYGDSFIPLDIEAGQTLEYSLHHLYQNWGVYPLKQISSIQFHISYYHLSTGVTESNCIAPYYVFGKDLWTLPDFRGCSGNMWAAQPQYNSVGRLRFVSYMNKGLIEGTEYTGTIIHSAGPTYADIEYSYISDCGSFKYTLRHVEFPQNDENRTYYTLSLEFLKDLSIKDVKNNFTLFSFDGRSESYGKMSHTNENGDVVYKDIDKTEAFKETVNIGNENPFFSYYGLNNSDTAIMNFAYIMKDYDIQINGKEWNGDFALRNIFDGALNYGEISLMEDDVTFKKGDYINIDFILLPWGDGIADTDENVQYVRQDSVFNPVKITATKGTVVEDEYIPQVLAADNTAEFKLSGGRNRIVVKIDGMRSLNGIFVQEFTDGEWGDYSFQKNEYDGYQIIYNEDGTYSYAFVVEIDETGKERMFKVTAKQ